MSDWLVAITRHNRESSVESLLREEGFETYLPRIREKILLRGRAYYRQVPLFPSYIFVAMLQTAHIIARTSGVLGVLRGAGDHWATISDAIIRELKSRQCRRGFVQLQRFRIGQKVRIKSGPFAGRVGLYQGMSSPQREAVLLELIGCRLHLALGHLETATA